MFIETPMTNSAEPTELPAGPAAPDTPAAADAALQQSPLLVRMHEQDSQVAVLSLTGELDLSTVSQVAEVLWPRVLSTHAPLVVDLGGVTFLGACGLELLAGAHAYTQQRGTALGIVSGNRSVERALEVGELDVALPCHADVPTAVQALRQRTGEHAGQQTILPSILACEVCGHRDLQQLNGHDASVDGVAPRLICQFCGAHRTAGPKKAPQR